VVLSLLAAAVVVALPSSGSATPIKPPGGGESFNIHPGDSFRVGYDFTIPGNKAPVTVTWTNPQAVVNFTCSDGGSGSFTIPMPSFTVTVSDSAWYPSGDQHSALVYQGSITAPDGCGGGQVMKQQKIATFTADVTSSPSGVKVSYRFHDVDNNASGSWSSTQSVVTSPLVPTTGEAGYLTICKSAHNDAIGEFGFELAGQVVTVVAGGCSTAIELPAGPQVVHELPSAGCWFLSASTSPEDRLVAVDPEAANATATVVAGAISTATTLTVVNYCNGST
jgi:hypothetical protein